MLVSVEQVISQPGGGGGGREGCLLEHSSVEILQKHQKPSELGAPAMPCKINDSSCSHKRFCC